MTNKTNDIMAVPDPLGMGILFKRIFKERQYLELGINQ
jgi:hypothetical protein